MIRILFRFAENMVSLLMPAFPPSLQDGVFYESTTGDVVPG
jgi:hypothetical protein